MACGIVTRAWVSSPLVQAMDCFNPSMMLSPTVWGFPAPGCFLVGFDPMLAVISSLLCAFRTSGD